jgi:hypothetical protein
VHRVNNATTTLAHGWTGRLGDGAVAVTAYSYENSTNPGALSPTPAFPSASVTWTRRITAGK